MSSIDQEAESLIIQFECGEDQGKDSNPNWAGGMSGITIGIGDDLGYRSESEFQSQWEKYLSTTDIDTLSECCGVIGENARDMLSSVKSIKILWTDAVSVFSDYIIPDIVKTVASHFPGSDSLPSPCLGAMVSLVYNRGPGVLGSSRSEMKTIRSMIPNKAFWSQIPAQFGYMIQTMGDRWGAPTQWNISGRRLFEAALFAKGLRSESLLPATTVILGDSGASVAAMQKKLQAAGSNISADGSFGPQTMIAVYRRQVSMGKPASGVYTNDF